jgi:hypothetical protein
MDKEPEKEVTIKELVSEWGKLVEEGKKQPNALLLCQQLVNKAAKKK